MLRRLMTSCARAVMTVITWSCLTWAYLVWACLAGPAAADDPPRRIVSFNLCADQLVVALADPEQIVGLSPHAAEPKLSAVADQARAFRRLPWQAESTIPFNPDLVLVGAFDRAATQRTLRPDYLVLSSAVEAPDGQGALYLAHPVLRTLYPPSRRIILPSRYTLCGGPALIAALDYLTGVVTRLAADSGG